MGCGGWEGGWDVVDTTWQGVVALTQISRQGSRARGPTPNANAPQALSCAIAMTAASVEGAEELSVITLAHAC